MPLYTQVLIAVIFGGLLGVIFGQEPYLGGITNAQLGKLGMVVVQLLKTLAIPLIFFAILDALIRTSMPLSQGTRLLVICLVNVTVAMTIGLVIMNTWLHHEAYAYTDALRRWNAQWQADGLFGLNVPDKLSLGWFMMVSLGHMTAQDLYGIVSSGTYPQLTPEAAAVRRAYDAPFEGLGRQGHAGPRRFPLSLPFYNPEGGAAADQARWFAALDTWTKPIHFIWGGADNVFTEDWGRAWAGRFPQASFDVFADAGHFLQDTHGERIAETFLARRAEP